MTALRFPREGRPWMIVMLFLIFGSTACLVSPNSVNAGLTKADIKNFWVDQYDKTDRFGVLPASKGVPLGNSGYKIQLLAKAKPDECFQGVGNPANILDSMLGFMPNYPGDLTDDQISACRNIAVDPQYLTLSGYAQPKTNQAYVWGLTLYGNTLWFGTISNTHCLVIGSYLGSSDPSLNGSWVCEGGQGLIGDYRPPRVFYRDFLSKNLVDVTGKILAKGEPDATRLKQTIGLRSAGSLHGVIFLGGVANQGVNIFAFNAKTKEYIGSVAFNGQNSVPLYTNIRQWKVVANNLYVGVGKPGGGEILRWKGSLSSDPAKVFSFETVGEIGGDPAYLTPHDGRLFVSTWPAGGNEMSIWMSRPCTLRAKDRLTTKDAQGWQKVWSISSYEPEPTVAATVGGGAIMSYKGYLYWGTMHVPGVSLLSWQQVYGDKASDDDKQAAILGTLRAISIFRGKSFGTSEQKVELLYGNPLLPTYSLENGWQTVPNNMGSDVLYGLAGFNHLLNNYTWWMETYDDRLFIGTMDFSYLLGAQGTSEYDTLLELMSSVNNTYGADLWSFGSSDAPAVAASVDGLGNFANYGIRTMLRGNHSLILGTANPMNITEDRVTGANLGGWELYRMTKPTPKND